MTDYVEEYIEQSNLDAMEHAEYSDGYWHNNSSGPHSDQHTETWNSDNTGRHGESHGDEYSSSHNF